MQRTTSCGGISDRYNPDPLHGATTEQVLYRRVAGWIEELNGQTATYAVMESGNREYSVELTQAELIAAVEDRYRQLVDLVRRLKRPGEPTPRCRQAPSGSSRIALVLRLFLQS